MKTHEVYFDHSGIEPFQELIKQSGISKTFVLCDEITAELCLPVLNKMVNLRDFTLILIPSGESYKTIETCNIVWEELTKVNADRKALLINLGGGVLTDLGGFAASCYKRGIRFVNIPTTLLAMVDASTGGKTGVDFGSFKNQIGVFSAPQFTWVHSIFLKSLPANQIRSGAAEMIKHGLIYDPKHFDEVISNFNDLTSLISDSVSIKQAVVAQDPTEKGLRKILNFGHTLGHAIESFYLKTPSSLLHGEAIAVGMILEAFLSYRGLGLSKDEMVTISNRIQNLYDLPTINPADYQAIIELTKQDKKNEHGSVRFVGLEQIGKAVYDVPLEAENILEAFSYYKEIIL